MEGDEHGHGYALFDKEIAAAREAMGWTCAAVRDPGRHRQGLAQGRAQRRPRAAPRAGRRG